MCPVWAAAFIGIKFQECGRDRDACDCYGLIHLVYATEFGIALPSYTEDYATLDDKAEIERLVKGGLGPWQEVAQKDAKEGDIIIFRIEGRPIHIGLVLDAPYFLHVERGTNSCRDRFDSLRWQKRITGFYRHEALVGVAR